AGKAASHQIPAGESSVAHERLLAGPCTPIIRPRGRGVYGRGARPALPFCRIRPGLAGPDSDAAFSRRRSALLAGAARGGNARVGGGGRGGGRPQEAPERLVPLDRAAAGEGPRRRGGRKRPQPLDLGGEGGLGGRDGPAPLTVRERVEEREASEQAV